MLLWQPQNFLKARTVFCISVALHLCACFALLFVYKDYHQRLVVDLSSRISSHAIVKLLPLSASRSSSHIVGKSLAGKGKQASASSVKPGKNKKKSPTFLAKQAVAHKAAPSGKGKKGKVEKAKTSVQAKKTALEKEKINKEIKEKVKKETRTAKEEVKMESAKQEVVEVVQEATTGATEAVKEQGQDILYLTQQEFDSLKIQQKLQECLFDVWTPPAGIPQGVLCEVLLTVGWDGVILETQFLKKTDILMYDLSVQETLEQVVFPHELWGKHVTIAFKP